MDYRQLFSDVDLKQEFLDRFPNLTESATAGLEGLDGGGPNIDDASAAVDSMQEGTWTGADPGLEAIIERFTRPVYLVQDSSFGPPPDDFEDSEQIAIRLEEARLRVEPVIPSAGRIDLRNHRKAWVGTGWMVAPSIVATNRHVAEEFARSEGDGFVFRKRFGGGKIGATLDWKREHARPDESRFRVKEILWIEPEESFDVALLKIVDEGEDGEHPPAVVELLTEADFKDGVGRWIGVIGYPARDSRNDLDDQHRIFDGIYNVKRLAPGQITSVRPDGLIEHDATTLGGNSGSVVLDLEKGKAIGIHFGGIEGEGNFAVQAPRLAKIIEEHAVS
jgi:endonuclease G